MAETLFLNRYTITIDTEIPLPDALESMDSDTQAWAMLLFTNLVENLIEPPIHRCTSKFFDNIVLGGTDDLRCLTLSRLREGRHAWVIPYLMQEFESLRQGGVSRLVKLVGELCSSYSIDPYRFIPHLVGLLDEDSNDTRQAALDSIAQIESQGVDPLSEFVRSSYGWHVRSIHLERMRWMAIFGLLGTIGYGTAVAFAASLIFHLSTGKAITIIVASNLVIFILILLLSVLSIYYATDAENELERCLKISNIFLEQRKEMRKQVQAYFIKLLENKHKKWRTIMTTLLRLYLSMIVPLLIVHMLGFLPMGVVENPLYVLTLTVLMLSFVVYDRMKRIEIEMVEKQKVLREYYGR